jgi:hypothetical protein
MKVIEKMTSCGPSKAYEDIPEELQRFTPGCLVQPAPFISQPSLKFYFYRKFEPGEDKHSPQGTIVARGSNGVKYGFDLDQVIVWIPKKEIVSLEPIIEETCNYIKKNGTRCQIKTKEKYCRFHKKEENG